MDESLRDLERRARAGEPGAARAYEAARARSGVPVCDLRHEGRSERACVHLLARAPDAKDGTFVRRFTGRGSEHHLTCEECPDDAPPLADACAACFRAIVARDRCAGRKGEPAVLVRPSSLELRVNDVATSGGALGIAPVPGTREWVVATNDRLRTIELETGRCSSEVPLEPLAGERTLLAREDLVVLGETRGPRALVIDRSTGRVLQRLAREEYQLQHCRHPLAFFEHRGRLLLVHATHWNRLEVIDPRTGERLTERPAPPEGPHLEFFHGGLTVSPDDRWVVDDGWVWHPVGITNVFSLERWLDGNRFESETGESRHDLEYRYEFWDSPVAWLDEKHVAFWGLGEGEDVLNAVLVHSIEERRTVRFFAMSGGASHFFVDRGRLVTAGKGGLAVWDPATGERLLESSALSPVAYHPDTHELVEIRDGRLVRGTIQDVAPQAPP